MYEEYDKYFDKPGVVDGVLEGAMWQIHEHLKAEIRGYLADVVAAETKKKTLEEEIRQNENRLASIESRIKEAREEELNVKTLEMPRKYIEAFVRNEIGNFVPAF